MQAAGIKVVDWEPMDHALGWDIVVSTQPALFFLFQVHSP
jgi:hypothetical protein